MTLPIFKPSRKEAKRSARKTWTCAFSLLFNESDEYLLRYITNFLSFTDSECILIVNYPSDRQAPDISSHSDRVHLINGQTKRFKWGHTLLMGHIESLTYATEHFDFTYFCTLASNGLFVRNFNSDIVEKRLSVPSASRNKTLALDELPDQWMWPNLRRNEGLKAWFREELGTSRVSNSQIEGLIADREQWSLILSRAETIRHLGEVVGSINDYNLAPEQILPMEEIVPSTIMNVFGSGQYCNIFHLFWDRFRQQNGRVQVADLINLDRYAPLIMGFKWFGRDANDTETMAVTRRWSTELLDEINRASAAGDLTSLEAYRRFLFSMAEAVDQKLERQPLSQAWPTAAGTTRDWRYSFKDLAANRQVIPLQGNDAWTPGKLYMENTGHKLDIDLNISEDGLSRLTLSCVSEEAPEDSHQGYLYLYPKSAGPYSVSIQVEAPVSGYAEMVMKRIVLHYAGRYHVHPPDEVRECGGNREYRILLPGDALPHETGIGIPLYANRPFQCRLALAALHNHRTA